VSAEGTELSRERPLIVLICRVELLGEALRGALDEIGEVRMFRAGMGDTDGLLRSLGPDAVVVDDDAEAEAARVFVTESNVLLVEVSYADERLRLFVEGEWRDDEQGGISPEAVRNALVGRLLGRASRA
jgi:hypothetical protein